MRLDPTSLVGQLRPIAFFKGVQLGGMALFTVAAPRFMGPELFGQFVVIMSLNTLWMATSNLGARFIFGRFVPEYASRGATARVRALFMNVVELRVLIALLVAPALYYFLHRVLPQASTLALAGAAASFVLMTVAAPMYSVFYGLNQLGVSMQREAFSRYALLALLFVCGGFSSLERAALALCLMHGIALAWGVYLSRHLFTFARGAHDLRDMIEHGRFGLAIFGSNLLLRMPWRLGESALALAGIAASEIACFNIALSAPVAYTRLLGESISLQVPTLSLKHSVGDRAGRDESLGAGLRFLTAGSLLFVATVLVAGPFGVRLLFGERYLDVLPLLGVVVLATLPAPTIRAALAVATVEGRIGRAVALGGCAVTTFAAMASWLVPRDGARGAAWALVAALVATAGIALVQLRATGVLAAARMRRLVAAALAPVALVVLARGAALPTALAAAVYLVLLFLLGVVTRGELRLLWSESRRRRAPRRPSGPDEERQ